MEEIDGEQVEEVLEEIVEIKCDLLGYSKSKAIRKKDEFHSTSTNRFEYWKCLECEKWHVSSTGEKREKATKKTNQNADFTGRSETN